MGANPVSYNANGDHTTADFSILSTLEDYRHDGAFTLKLLWPLKAAPNYQTWIQTSNPVTRNSGGVTGYRAVDIHFTDNQWGGLEYNTGPNSFIDGSVNHGNWFYAIGSNWYHNRYSTTVDILGPNGPEQKVELYVLGVRA